MSWQIVENQLSLRLPNKLNLRDKLLLIRLEALVHSASGKRKLNDDWIFTTDNAVSDLEATDSTIVIYTTAPKRDIRFITNIIDNILTSSKLDVTVIITYDNLNINNIIDVTEQLYDRAAWMQSSVIGTEMGDLNADSDNLNDDYKLAMQIKAQNTYTPATFFTPQVLPDPIYLNSQELILFVGQQGAGKSTFLQQHPLPEKYVLIERKGNKNSYLQKAKLNLDNGLSVVVDATNPSNKSRDEFINMIRENNTDIPVRIFWFSRSGHISNAQREGKDKVADIALNRYSSEFKMPVSDEERNITVYRIN